MRIEGYKKEKYSITTDKSKIDISVVHCFLTTSYWSEKISVEIVQKSIDNSLCFGVYSENKQIGFARVISDYATFAYLADVFIIDEERGKGLSKWLMECILSHHKLQGLRNFCLLTRDAHTLYERFGFKNIAEPKNFMSIKVEGIYKKNQ